MKYLMIQIIALSIIGVGSLTMEHATVTSGSAINSVTSGEVNNSVRVFGQPEKTISTCKCPAGDTGLYYACKGETCSCTANGCSAGPDGHWWEDVLEFLGNIFS